MEVRVDPVAGDAGWYSGQPTAEPGARKRRKPSGRPTESEESAPQADDCYTPSEPSEEG
jgi:hypothetical protein